MTTCIKRGRGVVQGVWLGSGVCAKVTEQVFDAQCYLQTAVCRFADA